MDKWLSSAEKVNTTKMDKKIQKTVRTDLQLGGRRNFFKNKKGGHKKCTFLFFYFANTIMNIRILCFVSFIGNVSMMIKLCIETCKYKKYARYPCTCNKIHLVLSLWHFPYKTYKYDFKLPSTYYLCKHNYF
jgi:hypothetical protein